MIDFDVLKEIEARVIEADARYGNRLTVTEADRKLLLNYIKETFDELSLKAMIEWMNSFAAKNQS